MGCDMHIHQEIKIGGSWQHYAYKRPERDYELFWLIAGVRGPYDDIEPIAWMRGVPGDATKLTLIDYRYQNGDAHSATFLTGIEIDQVETWLENKRQSIHMRDSYFGYLFGNSWGCLIEHPDSQGLVGRNITAARFIIWFDN